LNRFVVDCSVVVSWCFSDENSPFATGVLAALTSPEAEALAPPILPLELANVLLAAERRGRLNTAKSARFLKLLFALPIAFDGTPPEQNLDAIAELGRHHGLSSYDASYLELAVREGVPIATLDDRMRAVAAQLGVPVYEPEVT
jgi:predicted nucleic acid-binding protein